MYQERVAVRNSDEQQSVPFFCGWARTDRPVSIRKRCDPRDYDLPSRSAGRDRLAIDAQDRVYFSDFKGGIWGGWIENRRSELWDFAGGRSRIRMESRSRRMEWCGTGVGREANTMVRFDPKTETLPRRIFRREGG